MLPSLSIKDALFTLLVKVAVAGAIAAILLRSSSFKKLLTKEQRDFEEKANFVLFLGSAYALGVLTRILLRYRATDLSLEGPMVVGLLGGRVAGLFAGAMISLPAFFNGELLALPMGVLYGFVGGLLRESCRDKEQIWTFGPFLFLNIPSWFRRFFREGRANWQILPILSVVVLELLRIAVGRAFPTKLFYLDSHQPVIFTLILLTSIITVALPLKIWNNTRMEMKIEDQERLLMKARMDALTSQINPHFLFNTLNAASSLIRIDPDTARVVLLKLSNILRRLLRKQESFVPLREELAFMDDYLDIEVIRFGRDKLEIVKEIDEQTLDAIVPSMILQPIIENSIKHGLSPRLEGGVIRIRTSRANGCVVIEIDDNGVGIPPERIGEVYNSGIGISNVNERLKVLYGHDYQLKIESREGKGTYIRIEVPELVAAYREP